jgi:hypothetical protein
MTTQQAFTAIAPIKPDQVGALRQVLDPIGANIGTTPAIKFALLDKVHFMRWVILDPDPDPEYAPRVTPAQLALETNFDGPLEDHLDQLIQAGSPLLVTIYGLCEGFPPGAQQNPATSLKTYLLAHQRPVPTFYVGTRGLTVGQIRKDQALRCELETQLDVWRQNPAWLKSPPDKMRQDLLAFIQEKLNLQWALTPVSSPSPLSTLGSFLLGVLNFLIRLALFLLPFAVEIYAAHSLGASAGVSWAIGGVTLAGLFVYLLLHELMDNQTPITEDLNLTRAVAGREDHLIQNQMTDVVFVKRGVFRQITLRSVLWAINWLARYWFNKGELGGIPSIHFARWVILDGGRRLLFFSNFDGSWESYLDDFIDKAAGGLTAVWSNAFQFPRSYLLYFGGARDEKRFKPYVRDSQVPTQVWYSAYPDLSVQNINNNARIRRMLSGNPGAQEVEACLRLL